MILLQQLARYQPIVVEGMGYYDPRDPVIVARQIVKQLQNHWAASADVLEPKPMLLITQGDPLHERGISAITPLVSDMLGIQRGLVVLDEHIDPNHSRNAPRDNVEWEVKYSDLVGLLDGMNNVTSCAVGDISIATRLEKRVDESIAAKNQRRADMEKPPLKSYFKTYAMLQEVTKAACRAVCGDITVAHTAHDISDFSVTSFYEVGLDLGLLDRKDYVAYGAIDDLNFEKIDTR
jgi:hypothetical protein